MTIGDTLQPFERDIRSIEPDDGGSMVELVCGHSIWCALAPNLLPPFRVSPGGKMYCAACMNDYLDSVRDRKEAGGQ